MPLDLKDNLLRTLHHDRPDYVPWWDEGVCLLVDYSGRQPPRDRVDEWGVVWSATDEPAMAQHAGAPGDAFGGSYPSAQPVRPAASVLAGPLPDGSDPAPFAGLLDGVDRTRILPIGRHPLGPLDRLMALLGADQALLALLEEAAAVQAILDGIASYHVAIARNYLSAGVEAGWLADDYAGALGPLLSLRLWREMILPGLRRIVAVYRDAGALVFFHTCGKAEDFVSDLLAAGVTAFNLESQICNLPALKKRYGRHIAFVGGVPAGLMLHGRPDEVRQAALAAMTWGRDGGLVLAPDQWLAYPEANVRALRQAASSASRHDGMV